MVDIKVIKTVGTLMDVRRGSRCFETIRLNPIAQRFDPRDEKPLVGQKTLLVKGPQ